MGYPPPPPPSGGGPAVVRIAIVALLLLATVGVGAMFALKLGPFAPGATPLPTLVAERPTPTAVAATPTTLATTLAPTAMPVERPTAGASVPPNTPSVETPLSTLPLPTGSTDVAAALLAHVPDAMRDSCLATTGSEPVTVLATCTADGGDISVTYFQYPDSATMGQAYDDHVSLAEIEHDTGGCIDVAPDGAISATLESWPAESTYTIGDEESGRWLCTDAVGVPTVFWTDERLLILSQASHNGSDYDRLVDFWANESGPYE